MCSTAAANAGDRMAITWLGLAVAEGVSIGRYNATLRSRMMTSASDESSGRSAVLGRDRDLGAGPQT